MAKVLITGTNRGIGLELVRQSLAQGDEVIATCREPAQATALQQLVDNSDALRIMTLDLLAESGIDDFAAELGDEAVDCLINNAGIYGQREARLGNIDAQAWHQAFHVNTIAPLLLTEKLLPNLRRGSQRRLAYLSSKMGSIADNGSGGSYVYRSSKTALNQVVRSLAMDLAAENFIVLSLHPGWVLTDMGGPNALIDTETSVRGLLQVIRHADATQSGAFLNYDGQTIPY